MKTRINISKTIRQMVFARDGWMCVYCWKEPTTWRVERGLKPFRINLIPLDEKGREFEIDHVVPYCETKDNSFYNLVTSCWECNNRKSNRRWKNPCIRKLKI